MDIVQIIFEQFSERKIDPASEYKKVMDQVIDDENTIRNALDNKQKELLLKFEKSSDELQSLSDYELIQFVLDFVSSTINYKK